MWGYTKVNACVLLGGNSVGVATPFPASIAKGKAAVVGVHSFWPVAIGKRRVRGYIYSYTLSCQYKQEEKSAGVHSFFPVLDIVTLG